MEPTQPTRYNMLYMNNAHGANHNNGTMPTASMCASQSSSFTPSAAMQQLNVNMASEMEQLSASQQAEYLRYVQYMQQYHSMAGMQHAQSLQMQQWNQMSAAQQYQYYQQLQQYQQQQMQYQQQLHAQCQSQQQAAATVQSHVAGPQQMAPSAAFPTMHHFAGDRSYAANQDGVESNQHGAGPQMSDRQTTRTGESALTATGPAAAETSKSALSATASEWLQNEDENPLPGVASVQRERAHGSKLRRLRPQKAPRVDPEPLVMPRAQEETTLLAPNRCIIFDRDGYKLFALGNGASLDALTAESKDHSNDSPSTHTLNGDAAEFVPSSMEPVADPPSAIPSAMPSAASSLHEMVRTLLDSALSGGAMAAEMEETVSSLMAADRMADGDYFCALFDAVTGPHRLRRVMTDAVGPAATAALFGACSEVQKVGLLQTLSPGDSICYVACHEHGYRSLLAMVPTLSTTEQISYLIEALIRNMKTLGTDYYGVRLLNAYFEQGAVEGMMDMVIAIVDHVDLMARSEYGWFCYYKLLRSQAPPSVTDPIKKALYGKYAAFCRHPHAVKVAEQCLRHSLADDEAERDPKGWAIVILRDILRESELLVADEFGKHVFHLALLSKVKGEIGGLSDDLKELKDRANDIYQRHVQRKRSEKITKIAHSEGNGHGEEAQSTERDGGAGSGTAGDTARSALCGKADGDEFEDAELDVIVHSAVTEGDVLEFVGFDGFVEESAEAQC